MSFSLGLVGACLAGLAAGLLMTLFEFPFWKKWGMEGVAEWQVNAVMGVVVFAIFDILSERIHGGWYRGRKDKVGFRVWLSGNPYRFVPLRYGGI